MNEGMATRNPTTQTRQYAGSRRTTRPTELVPAAERVIITKDTLTVDLSDGRTISVPLAWFPRLLHATLQERRHWRLIGKGLGIHWEDIDEDISVEGLLAGRPSGESQSSFKKWLEQRPSRKRTN
jgi:hypothetical protein